MTLEDKVDDASLNTTGPDLKVVTTMTSVSLDHLSSPALAKRGIIATNINEIPSLLWNYALHSCLMQDILERQLTL